MYDRKEPQVSGEHCEHDEFRTGCTEGCPDDCMADHQGEQ